MGNSEVKKTKSQCESDLELLDKKISYALSHYKYDHYAIFLIYQEIKFTIDQLNKLSLTNKSQIAKFNSLQKQFEDLTKLYETIRGDTM